MKQISNSSTIANTSATATLPIMFTGKTAASGLATAAVISRPLPITATKIATGIRKMIPPMIVVLRGFSMTQWSLVHAAILASIRRDIRQLTLLMLAP